MTSFAALQLDSCLITTFQHTEWRS